jgi:hypothetical protein
MLLIYLFLIYLYSKLKYFTYFMLKRPKPTVLKHVCCRRRQHFKFFDAVVDSA